MGLCGAPGTRGWRPASPAGRPPGCPHFGFLQRLPRNPRWAAPREGPLAWAGDTPRGLWLPGRPVSSSRAELSVLFNREPGRDRAWHPGGALVHTGSRWMRGRLTCLQSGVSVPVPWAARPFPVGAGNSTVHPPSPGSRGHREPLCAPGPHLPPGRLRCNRGTEGTAVLERPPPLLSAEGVTVFFGGHLAGTAGRAAGGVWEHEALPEKAGPSTGTPRTSPLGPCWRPSANPAEPARGLLLAPSPVLAPYD